MNYKRYYIIGKFDPKRETILYRLIDGNTAETLYLSYSSETIREKLRELDQIKTKQLV